MGSIPILLPICIVSSAVEQRPYKAKVKSSILLRCTNVDLADVVIATVWSTDEVGSIPTVYTNALLSQLVEEAVLEAV